MKHTKFNACFRYSTVAVARELGLTFISTTRQIENGTLMFHDPETNVQYSLHESGYIRRHTSGYRHAFMQKDPTYMYPLNKRTSWTKQSANGWKYRQTSSYQKAHGDEQLGILVRAVLNYRNK